LAVASPADDDVEALLEFGQQARDVGGIVLQVGVHRDDDRAAGMAEPGGHRRGLSEALPEADDANARLRCGQPSEDLERAITRAVVTVDELPAPAGRLERCQYGRMQSGQRLRLVEQGHDD